MEKLPRIKVRTCHFDGDLTRGMGIDRITLRKILMSIWLCQLECGKEAGSRSVRSTRHGFFLEGIRPRKFGKDAGREGALASIYCLIQGKIKFGLIWDGVQNRFNHED